MYHDGEVVLRGLTPQGAADWRAVAGTRFFPRAVAQGRIVSTVEEHASALPGAWAAVLRHERIPVVTYPYEWTFSMLRAAALLQLELLSEALAEDVVCKDATPFNVQWRGASPVFIDVGSFERLEPGTPWAGYRQFCRQFLYPLLLRAYKDVAFQPWLRGDIEGIPASAMAALLGPRDLARPGVLAHIVLPARAEARFASSDRDIRAEVKAAGFSKQLILANVRRLHALVRGLRWRPTGSTWAGYSSDCAHVTVDRDAKTRFVTEAVAQRRRRLVWDLGANDGHYALAAAPHADVVLALDGDELVLDRLFRRLEAGQPDNVTPLVVDLANPSPAQGWRGLERSDLPARGVPDFVLALAVLHHLVIGRNLPLHEVVTWLAGLRAPVMLEFAARSDPMVTRLLRAKRPADVHLDYDGAALRACLAAAGFSVERELALPSGHRTLLHLTPA